MATVPRRRRRATQDRVPRRTLTRAGPPTAGRAPGAGKVTARRVSETREQRGRRGGGAAAGPRRADGPPGLVPHPHPAAPHPHPVGPPAADGRCWRWADLTAHTHSGPGHGSTGVLVLSQGAGHQTPRACTHPDTGAESDPRSRWPCKSARRSPAGRSPSCSGRARSARRRRRPRGPAGRAARRCPRGRGPSS